MSSIKTLLNLSAILCVLTTVQAQTTIYQQTFTGDETHLAGTMPTEGAGDLWAGLKNEEGTYSPFKLDGSSALYGFNALPFTPEPGYIYTLTVKNLDNQSPEPNHWLGFGFSSDPNHLFSFMGDEASKTGALPFFSVHGDGAASIWLAGDGKTKLSFPIASLSIVLDTTSKDWTITYLVDDTELDFYTYADGNPLITHVGIGNTGSARGSISEFSLTSVRKTDSKKP